MRKKSNKVNPHIGSDFDSFLEEENLLNSVQIYAIKRAIAYLLQEKINHREITKTELAQQLGTSRAALDRILDPENTSINLSSLAKAADVLAHSKKSISEGRGRSEI